MTLPITNLRVIRYRSLLDVRMGPFGRVNLFTGKNNSGKSSVLEAIRILATEGSSSTLMSILSSRDEFVPVGAEAEPVLSPETTGPFSSLFSDFPDLRGCCDPFTVSNDADGYVATKRVSVSIRWVNEDRVSYGTRQLQLMDEGPDLFNEESGVPVLVIDAPSRRRLVRLESARIPPRGMFDISEAGQSPCVFLDPSSSRATAHLATLWDGIALTDLEGQVVEALRIISPDIGAVSVIGSNGSPRSRTAIVRSRRYSRPLPLRTFGDGLNRVFGIILSLCSAKGGVMVVDEIENGLHYSILQKVWQLIFQLARSLDVQVFATTHSWDCIEGFQKAAAKDPEDGVLIRMTNRDGIIIPTLFREDELAVAAREQIELR